MDSSPKLQKAHVEKSRLSLPVSLFSFICGTAALFFSYLSYSTLNSIQESNESHHQSYVLANQLGISSDKLTLMARTYVVTGKEKYLQFYNDILAIRNGTKPRPMFYQRIYWDLLMPEKAKAPFADGPKTSFVQLMLQLDLTDPESDLLKKAKKLSDQLTLLDFKAIDAAQAGVENSDNYPQSAQRLLALSLLYSNEYLLEKAKMMSLINEFFALQASRRADTLESMRFQHHRFTNLAMSAFMLLVGMLIYSLSTRRYSEKQFVSALRKEVSNRTLELFEKREQLKTVIAEMKATRDKLVEAEKMASLGNLVSGVAHEVNTPLGMGVTLASHLQGETTDLLKEVESGQLKRAGLDSYCREASETCQLLLSNLGRAANLIRSFKQVAVDQSCDEVRSFKVSQYLQEILLSLNAKLKKTKIEVDIQAPENEKEIQTYPGAIAQITTNLVMNALIHAFDNGKESGRIQFSIEFDKNHVQLIFTDDGHGMDERVRDKVFDPFFTTKRGSGGSGLGMNIVYNLAVHQLCGSISCQSSIGKGTSFLLRFPMQVKNKTIEAIK